MARNALFAYSIGFCSIRDVSDMAGAWTTNLLDVCNDAELASDLRVPRYDNDYNLTAVHCGRLARLATMGDGWLEHCTS